jgi:hypothetical protein
MNEKIKAILDEVVAKPSIASDHIVARTDLPVNTSKEAFLERLQQAEKQLTKVAGMGRPTQRIVSPIAYYGIASCSHYLARWYQYDTGFRTSANWEDMADAKSRKIVDKRIDVVKHNKEDLIQLFYFFMALGYSS